MIHYYTHIPLFMYSLTHPSIILILRTGASSGVLYQMLRNKGASQSRKIGLDISTGNYILYLDSDDWCESNMVERLYSKAICENLDIVFCNFYSERHTRYSNVDIMDKMNNIAILKQIFAKKLGGFLWHKIVKRYLYMQCSFPTANFLEDIFINTQMLTYTESIGYINDFLYHYCLNPTSICEDINNLKQRRLDSYINIQAIVKFLEDKYEDKIMLFEPELSDMIKILNNRGYLLHNIERKYETDRIV